MFINYWDNLPAQLLKSLTYFIDKSYETGLFPDSLKLAKVIPIYKSGDKTLLSNYDQFPFSTLFQHFLKKLYTIILLISLKKIIVYTNFNSVSARDTLLPMRLFHWLKK